MEEHTLHWCVQAEACDALKEACEKSSDLDAKVDVDGREWTALQYAAWKGNPQAVGILTSFDADPDAADENGQTALHLAAQNGRAAAATCLFRAGANLNVQDDNGATPLHLACAGGHLIVATLLLNKRASLHIRDSAGQTAEDVARGYKHQSIVNLIVRALTRDPSSSVVKPAPKRMLESTQSRLEQLTIRNGGTWPAGMPPASYRDIESRFNMSDIRSVDGCNILYGGDQSDDEQSVSYP